MDWIKAMVHVSKESVDIVAASLYELNVKGVEIQDDILTEEDQKRMHVDYLDPVIEPMDEAVVICYFSREDDVDASFAALHSMLEEIRQFVDIGSGKVERDVTHEEDWANNWKKFYKPFKLGKNIWIKPQWETIESEEDDIVIEIDPGMAFGSGTHETTSMCIELLQKYKDNRKSLVDVGCGSGILSIAGGKLGFENVVGIDIDPNAVKVARENVLLNGLEGQVEIFEGDLIEKIQHKADMVVANIIADVIIFLTADINKIMTEGGLFISSGIILAKIDDVCSALESNGFDVVEVVRKGEWAAVAAKRKG